MALRNSTGGSRDDVEMTHPVVYKTAIITSHLLSHESLIEARVSRGLLRCREAVSKDHEGVQELRENAQGTSARSKARRATDRCGGT